VIIFGWTIAPTILGSKVDQCATCGVTGPHMLIRKTWWATVFWIPLLLMRFQHGMACANCGAWTGIGFRTMRQAMKTRTLPLPGRTRSNTLDIRDQIAEETGHRPTEKELYDTVQVNPKRGPWDLAVKVWPILVLAVVAFLVIGAMLPSPPPAATPGRPVAHTCWLDNSGYVSGCRNLDGSMEGYAIGTETTCYYAEPLPTGDYTLYCPDAGPIPSGS
jgi:hypothetical protein